MQRFGPSLLDRLLDLAPAETSESVRPTFSLEQLKDTVARDVEALLNARRGARRDLKAAYPLADASVTGFGLDDFVSMSMLSNVDRLSVCRSLERAIAEHEPRLQQVRVSLAARDADTQRLCFTIQAVLQAHPLQEPVSFDAVLQTTTRNYAVKSGRRSAVPA